LSNYNAIQEIPNEGRVFFFYNNGFLPFSFFPFVFIAILLCFFFNIAIAIVIVVIVVIGMCCYLTDASTRASLGV
jgi:hypothetical protein